MNLPIFDETNMAGIGTNRARENWDRVQILAMYRDGRHTDDWQRYTWREMTESAFHLNAAWRALGLAPQETVAVMGKNRPRWIMAANSLLTANLTLVPVYPTLTADEVEYILHDSGARFAIADTLENAEKILAGFERLPRLERVYVMDPLASTGNPRLASFNELLSLGAEKLDEAAAAARIREITASDVAAIIYTSGTTGRPKGVVLTNGNFLSQRVVPPIFGFNKNDVFLNHLPFCHSFGMTADLFGATDAGATIAIADGLAPEQIRHGLTTIRPTVLMSVPRLFEKLYVEVHRVVAQRPERVRQIVRGALAVGKEVFDLKNDGQTVPFGLLVKYKLAKRILMKVRKQAGMDRVRIAYAGGAPTSRELCYFFQSLGIDIYQGYGLTETSPVANVNLPGKNKLGTVGPPIPGVEEKIAPDGEILIRGPNVMAGYHNKTEATADAIDAEGWFHTGDIGHLDKEGYLTITDRKKELIVTSGGKNVPPLTIEMMFNTERYIERAVVVGDRRKFLVALVCPNFDALAGWAKERGLGDLSRAELAAHPDVVGLMQARVKAVNEKLPRFEQIKKIAVMDHEFSEETGELTPTLKVKRRVVDAMYKDTIDAMYPEDDPGE